MLFRSGGPVAIWAQRRGWDKTPQRAVAQPFIMLSQCMALGWMALAGGTGAAALDPSALAFVPVSLRGAWCGLSIFRRLTDRQFGAATNVLLIVSGAAMLG